MPIRENDYYAKKPADRGQPLCPFCGSKDVYAIKSKKYIIFERVIAWSCANEKCRMYRKQFPSPSWGSGTGHR